MAYTGGPLNELNGKMGISAPYKSVPVMKLIKVHKPKSKGELVELIKFHYENDCECGIKSKGTVEDFGKNLFNSQKSYWKENRFSLKDCIQWEYDLFVVQSLKGGIVEKKAAQELNNLLEDYDVSEAEGYLDEELRIDLIVTENQVEICGIQVKPSTFRRMRREVITFHLEANKKWGKTVYFLYYDEDENFENLKELVEIIK
ncbi:MAG: MjaI family restriction endonuclease [Bacteroidetes bacterium]|nr:MjaI family restriction endonuclease [Bacteroidota bacterium]